MLDLPRRAAATLTVLALLLASACSSDPEDETPTMVALGDSVASGAGIEPSSAEASATACARSDRNYPSLVADALGARLTDVTCGGATTTTVLEQIDSLRQSTDLVTLTIGANDYDAAARYFTACFVPPANTAAACAQAVDASVAALPAAGDDVVSTIDRIRDRAPDARIALVGYLPLAPPTTCATTPIDPTAIAALAGYEDQLDRTLAAAAEEAEVSFVSLHDAARGHDSCSTDPWVNGLQPAAGDGAFLHPTAEGASAIAQAVRQELDDTSGS